MIFSLPTESIKYNPYILDFPVWKDSVWSAWIHFWISDNWVKKRFKWKIKIL